MPKKPPHWIEIIRLLKKIYPLYIRRLTKMSNAGETYFDNIKYEIRINSLQSPDGQIDTLLHEYAHAKSIDDTLAHKGEWGKNYAEIYQNWEKFNSE